MTGISTEICVESNARDAFFRDYHVVEVEDCVECGSLERDQASKTVIERAFGPVVPAEAVGAVWRANVDGPRGWHPEVKRANLLHTLEDRVEPSHTALVLIDVQNDFCHDQGAVGRRGEPFGMIKEALPRIRNLLEWARRAGCLVVHVQAQYGPMFRHVGSPYLYRNPKTRDGMAWTASAADFEHGELPEDLVEVCRPGTWGAEFVEGIGPVGDELVVPKHRFSAFVDTRLEQMLRSNGIRTVILGGVTTNCCVESTARDTAMRDYYLVVAEDCVAVKDVNRDLHFASIESMRMYFGLVEPSDRIIASWRSNLAKTSDVVA